MNTPLKPLNARPQQNGSAPQPETSQEPVDFAQAMARLLDAAECIAIIMERRALKEGLVTKEEATYEHEE